MGDRHMVGLDTTNRCARCHACARRSWLASGPLLVAVVILILMPAATGSQVGSLTTFTNGTVADANQVNANFQALRTAVNDNDTRIASLEAAPPHGQVISSLAMVPNANQTWFGLIQWGQLESATQILIPRDGTLEGFAVKPGVVLAAGCSVTVSVRINGADVGAPLTFTSADALSMKTDSVSSISVSAGDMLTFRATETAGVFPAASVHASVLLK